MDFYPAFLPCPTIPENFDFLSIRHVLVQNTIAKNLEFDHTLVPCGTKTATMNLLKKLILNQGHSFAHKGP
jgi:hypothetical protein